MLGDLFDFVQQNKLQHPAQIGVCFSHLKRNKFGDRSPRVGAMALSQLELL